MSPGRFSEIHIDTGKRRKIIPGRGRVGAILLFMNNAVLKFCTIAFLFL
jgi:hypothetical protein